MKNLLLIFILIFSSASFACPGCMSSTKSSGQDYTTMILAVFVALTYFPLFYLFKTIIKYKNINGRKTH